MKLRPISAHIVEVVFISGPFDNQQRAEIIIRNRDHDDISIELRLIVPAADAEQFHPDDVFALTLKRLP
jgi:hypothetical protein